MPADTKCHRRQEAYHPKPCALNFITRLRESLNLICIPQSETQKKELETVTFAEGDVWGIDILISSGEDGKVRALTF